MWREHEPEQLRLEVGLQGLHVAEMAGPPEVGQQPHLEALGQEAVGRVVPASVCVCARACV